jgi:carbon monoxide dehydrogenase subunit G
MPTTRRSRTIGATPEQVWRTVCDPHHLPRWWPRVQRVEAVDAERFTEVLSTDKGRSVRADFRVLESRAPQVRRFRQEVEGSPFERVLRSAETAIRLAPDGAGGTRVTVEIRQRLRGVGALGSVMVRRATRRVADEALEGLARLHGH